MQYPSLIAASVLLCLLPSASQSQTSPDLEIWPQYYLQVPLRNKLTGVADYSHRYGGLFEKRTQWIGRVGLNYALNDKFSIALGYAYSEYFTKNGVRRENRPWQQIQLENNISNFKISQRLRLEERFQEDRTSERFNYRLRYQVLGSVPLVSKQRLSVNVSDEVMVNTGEQVDGNRFDQNRLQAGVQIKLTANVFFAPAYLYIYQIQANKKDFRNINVLRTGLIYKR